MRLLNEPTSNHTSLVLFLLLMFRLAYSLTIMAGAGGLISLVTTICFGEELITWWQAGLVLLGIRVLIGFLKS